MHYSDKQHGDTLSPTEKPLALKLADEIGEDYCNCLPAYKDRGRTDPECESCNTEDWRHRAAAELRKQYEEIVRLTEALQALYDTAPSAECSDFHHPKKDRHEVMAHCPVLARYEDACLNARAALARAGVQPKRTSQDYFFDRPCKTGSQCTSKCQRCDVTDDEALLRQALEALELSQPAWCGQDEELHDQECIDHRAAIAALRERLK